MDKEIKDINDKLKKVEERQRELENRLHEYEREMDVRMVKIETMFETMNENLTEIRKDVKNLRSKPADRWDKISITIMTVVASSITTFLLSGVLK